MDACVGEESPAPAASAEEAALEGPAPWVWGCLGLPDAAFKAADASPPGAGPAACPSSGAKRKPAFRGGGLSPALAAKKTRRSATQRTGARSLFLK
jgi:hypothetical protein